MLIFVFMFLFGVAVFYEHILFLYLIFLKKPIRFFFIFQSLLRTPLFSMLWPFFGPVCLSLLIEKKTRKSFLSKSTQIFSKLPKKVVKEFLFLDILNWNLKGFAVLEHSLHREVYSVCSSHLCEKVIIFPLRII